MKLALTAVEFCENGCILFAASFLTKLQDCSH